jgi:hypothetical protein
MKNISISGFKSSIDVLDKLKRDHDILYQAITVQNSNEINDAFINFYTYAYHIKDWLKLEGFSSVEKYINENIELSVCADLCNLTKHKELNNGPRLKDPLYEIYKSGIRSSTSAYKASSAVPINATTYNIKLTSGKEFEILHLAQSIIALWKTYITT